MEEMKRVLKLQDNEPDLSELMSLSNYLNEHIEV